MRFTGKMVGGGGKPAVRPLAQGRHRKGMKLDQFVGNVIGSIDRRRTRVVIVVFPSRDGAITPGAAADVDYSGGRLRGGRRI